MGMLAACSLIFHIALLAPEVNAHDKLMAVFALKTIDERVPTEERKHFNMARMMLINHLKEKPENAIILIDELGETCLKIGGLIDD